MLRTISRFVLRFLGVALSLALCGHAWAIVYVDEASSSSLHDGSSWGNAFQTIQQAITGVDKLAWL